MKRTYPSKEIEEENRKLGEIICNSDDGMTIEEIIERYASERFKRYLKERQKEKERLWKEERIIVE